MTSSTNKMLINGIKPASSPASSITGPNEMTLILSEAVVTSVDVVDVDLTDLTSRASVVGFFVVHFFFCVKTICGA